MIRHYAVIHIPVKASATTQKKSIKKIFHHYTSAPLLKLILFGIVVVGIIILAAVLTFQLTGSLNWSYFIAGMLLMLAVVGCIISFA
jgi:hypothetical protein